MTLDEQVQAYGDTILIETRGSRTDVYYAAREHADALEAALDSETLLLDDVEDVVRLDAWTVRLHRVDAAGE